jgi:TetR/AcrR family transcriptional repressor of nem operon
MLIEIKERAMPWDKDHKERTRRRIVEAAATAFRAHGVNGAGLTDIMQMAGLTHGGFYAHFESKDELIGSALAFLNERRLARFGEHFVEARHASALVRMADLYLSSRHREHPETGCAVSALGGELAREDSRARRQLSKNIEAWLAQAELVAPGSSARAKQRNGTGAYAAMIGGIILARVTEDPHEADRILEDVRAFLRASLDTAQD